VTIFINKELCDGCGECVEICPSEAIFMVDGKVRIDELLCTSCETCISLCPKKAIQKMSIPEPIVHISTTSRLPAQDLRVSEPMISAVVASDPKPVSFIDKLGVALFALGREVLPYIGDGLTTILENRIASPKVRTATNISQPNFNSGLGGRGMGSQQRRRRRIRGKRVY